MELTELKDKICKAFTGSEEQLDEILQIVENDKAIFPFNEYERLICRLIETGGLKYDDYMSIRTQYMNENPNLWIFEISNNSEFGEKFAHGYLKEKCSKLIDPKGIDSEYKGQYDLLLDNIKIEVKASRAVDSKRSKEPLYVKALPFNTDRPFNMNFQQLKPDLCDVFIWIAVFRDEIITWVLNSKEVSEHSVFSAKQHRGNVGEGQLHIKNSNIHLFDKFKLKDGNLEKAIRNAFRKK